MVLRLVVPLTVTRLAAYSFPSTPSLPARPPRFVPIVASPCSAVTYNAGPFQGQGIVWNFSLSGLETLGRCSLQVGPTCSLTVNLPNEERIFVAAAMVRWVRGQEFGLENLAVEKQTHSRVEHVIK